MIWYILLIIAAIGFCFCLFLHLGTKDEEKSIGGQIGLFDDKFKTIGRVFHQDKVDFKLNETQRYERCIFQNDFLFSYDKYNNLEFIAIVSEDKWLNIFTCYRDNVDESYTYINGTWDSYIITAMNELYKLALDKEMKVELEKAYKEINTTNYFNELFTNKENE